MPNSERNCKNPNVVVADGRLLSPHYNKTWLIRDNPELMCYFMSCGTSSYNAWLKDTSKYIDNKLRKHLNTVRKRAAGVYGTNLIPLKINNRLKVIQNFIDDWDKQDFKPKSVYQESLNWSAKYWNSQVEGIIHYFDEAACLMDVLNDMLDELDASEVKVKPPIIHQDDDAGGGKVNPNKPKSGMPAGRIAIGAAAIGFGGYFLFKALTE